MQNLIKTFLISLLIISCSKEQIFNCADVYKVKLQPDRSYALITLDEETYYKADLYSQENNKITYIWNHSKIRLFTYDISKKALSVASLECNKI